MTSGPACASPTKRAVIAFDVDAGQVSIIGVFYGGQDCETILQDDFEDGQER